MEGNDCYKFSTIKNFVEKTHAAPISRILDIGANVGNVLLEMKGYFPQATILGVEPVPEYVQRAREVTQLLGKISVVHGALSYQHLFVDDLGSVPRSEKIPLRILQARPESGPGWIGGSMILPSDHGWVQGEGRAGYSLAERELWPFTLEDLLGTLSWNSIDILKLDCEGSENSILGCSKSLGKIRFIVGEYHDLERFYRVMENRLFRTHKVNLVGGKEMGAFFAERLEGERDGILKFDDTGMLQLRSWLSPKPIRWHLFNEAFIAPTERIAHGFSP